MSDFKLLKRENAASSVTCQHCGVTCSAIIKHLKTDHPDRVKGSLSEAEEQYHRTFPDSPLYTLASYEHLMAKLGRVEPAAQQVLHEEESVTEVTSTPQAGKESPRDSIESAIPEVDENYIKPELELALLNMAIEQNKPAYFYGMAGNGKTSLVEQYCARHKRPMIRVQHSGGLEEYEIIGSERVNADGSYFGEGLLPKAMRNGYVYLADEYDFAQASVLAVYQAVLEGKPLVINGPDNGTNVVKPHPDFRFVALGNTNGAGDDTGLFQGTKIQNAANMERFAIVQHMRGLTEEQERQVILNKTTADERLADEIIEYTKMVRKAYTEGRISNTIGGIRVILNIASNGIGMGDMRLGSMTAFSNRLPARDAHLVEQFAQRVWG